jgi:Transposase DDE domain group 1
MQPVKRLDPTRLEKAKRARKAETPKQPSLCLRLRAPYFYPDSDAGLLLLRQAERKLGVCRRLAEAMPDRRDQSRVDHTMVELVMARTVAIPCGYEDGNDFNRLRHDPLMKVAVGRCPETGKPVASQSTISRLENAPCKTEAARLTGALCTRG